MKYGEVLKEAIKNDDKYFVLTAENLGTLYYVMDDISNNMLDVGIAEQTMAGIASGLALRGRKPIIHALSAFLMMRAYEFLRTDIGIGNLPVKITGILPGFLSDTNGPTHQSIEDIALARSIPNMNIFCPSDNDELISGMKKILQDKKPWYIRYNDQPSIVEHTLFLEGKAEVIGDGKDVAIFTYGYMFNEVIKASRLLEQSGVSCRVINIRTIRPFDVETVVRTANKCKYLFSVEDHLSFGGLSTLLYEVFQKQSISTKLNVIALEDYFKPGLIDQVMHYANMSAEKLYFRMMNEINK